MLTACPAHPAVSAGVALELRGSASAQADADFELIRDWDAGRLDDREHGDAAAPPRPARSGRRATYADFVLRFEYRLAAAGAGAELLLRARGAPDGPLDYGYRVALGGETSGRRPRGRLRADGTQMRAGMYTGPRTPSANGRWVACEVRAERETLSVSLDGMVVSVAERADAFSGFVAFEATGAGGLELRGVRIAGAAARGGRHARTASRRAGPASRGRKPRTRSRRSSPHRRAAARVEGTVMARVRDRGRRPAR